MIEGFLRIGFVVSCFLGFSAASRAVDPVRPLEQLRLANWNQQKGLPQDSILGVAQTSERLPLGHERGKLREIRRSRVFRSGRISAEAPVAPYRLLPLDRCRYLHLVGTAERLSRKW